LPQRVDLSILVVESFMSELSSLLNSLDSLAEFLPDGKLRKVVTQPFQDFYEMVSHLRNQ